jgi:hypothetical protein
MDQKVKQKIFQIVIRNKRQTSNTTAKDQFDGWYLIMQDNFLHALA